MASAHDRNWLALVAALAFAAGALAQAPLGIERELVPLSAGPLLGAADFDGDGDVDLLTVLTGIYVNDGNGRFSPHPVLSPISSYVAMAIADLNGDGLPDVIAGTGSGLQAWVNVGGVLIQTNGLLPILPPGPFLRSIAAGDIDGDGDQDLVIGRAGTPVILWKNLGPMLFVDASSQLPPDVLSPLKMQLIDLDGDGDRDLLMSNDSASNPVPSANRILMTNGGTGVFSLGTPGVLGTGSSNETFVTGDVNGDLLPDVAMFAFGSITLLVNLGGGVFTGVGLTIPGFAVLLDVNGDGLDELVLTSTQPGVEVRSVGPGPAISPPFQTLAVFGAAAPLVADFDGDGDRDLVLATTAAHRLILNTGQGLAEIPGYLSTPGNLTPGLQAVDLDGDGDVDLIGILGQSIVIARNDGNGQLDWQAAVPCSGPCPVWTSNVVFRPFDADGDGDLDLYVVDGWTNFLPPGDRLLLNTGSGFTAAVGWYSWGTVGQAIARGDLDGDGDDDLVVARLGPGATPMPVEVTLSLAGGTLSPPSAVAAASFTWDMVLVDVDADGDLDLVEANNYPGTGATSALFLNGGTGAFTLAAGFPAVPASTVRAGDLDGDGDPDLLLDSQVLLNVGNGAFTPGVNLPLPGFTAAHEPELIDANADGLLDVLHNGRVYLNTGAATFASPIIVASYVSGSWAVVADFDRDGDDDAVIPAGYPRLYSGLARQLARGLPARPGRPASFDLRGPSLGTWTLFASTGPAAIPLPPHGTVWIDPAPAIALGSGSFDATGRGSWSAVVPTSPSFVGQSFYVQAAVFGGPVPKLTGREIATVATY